MRSMQVLNNGRKAGVFSLIFAACLLLFLPGCQGPIGPQDLATGVVSLTIGSGIGRAIMPEGYTLDDFEVIEVVFTNGGQTVVGTIIGTSVTVDLSVGTWTLTINAYLEDEDEYPAARYVREITVVPGSNNLGTVVLRPIIEGEGEGTFSWVITFGDVDVESGTIVITGGDAPVIVELEDADDGLWEDFLPLDIGSYWVVVTLTNAEGYVASVSMDLHVFQNLESHFYFGFTPENFFGMRTVNLPLYATLLNAGRGTAPVFDSATGRLTIQGGGVISSTALNGHLVWVGVPAGIGLFGVELDVYVPGSEFSAHGAPSNNSKIGLFVAQGDPLGIGSALPAANNDEPLAWYLVWEDGTNQRLRRAQRRMDGQYTGSNAMGHTEGAALNDQIAGSTIMTMRMLHSIILDGDHPLSRARNTFLLDEEVSGDENSVTAANPNFPVTSDTVYIGIIVSHNNAAGTTTAVIDALRIDLGDGHGFVNVDLSGDINLVGEHTLSVTPATAEVRMGQTQQFNAVVGGVPGASQDVTWGIETTITGATISTTGELSIAANATAGLVTVIATSGYNLSATATVTVPAPITQTLGDFISFDGLDPPNPVWLATGIEEGAFTAVGPLSLSGGVAAWVPNASALALSQTGRVNNWDGIGLNLGTTGLDIREGDILTVTGSVTRTATGWARMQFGDGDSADPERGSFNIPEAIGNHNFTITWAVDDDRANTRVTANAASVIPSFVIHSIEVYRPDPDAVVTGVLGDFLTVTGFDPAPDWFDAPITVGTLVVPTGPLGAFYWIASYRVPVWVANADDSLSLRVDATDGNFGLHLNIDFAEGDTITVTGRTGVGAEGQVLVNAGGFSAVAVNWSQAAEAAINISGTFTAAQAADSPIRVMMNGVTADPAYFYIDSITIVRPVEEPAFALIHRPPQVGASGATVANGNFRAPLPAHDGDSLIIEGNGNMDGSNFSGNFVWVNVPAPNSTDFRVELDIYIPDSEFRGDDTSANSRIGLFVSGDNPATVSTTAWRGYFGGINAPLELRRHTRLPGVDGLSNNVQGNTNVRSAATDWNDPDNRILTVAIDGNADGRPTYQFRFDDGGWEEGGTPSAANSFTAENFYVGIIVSRNGNVVTTTQAAIRGLRINFSDGNGLVDIPLDGGVTAWEAP